MKKFTKNVNWMIIFSALLVLVVVTGCGAASPQVVEVVKEVEVEVAREVSFAVEESEVAEAALDLSEGESADISNNAQADLSANTSQSSQTQSTGRQRMIIKYGDIAVQVADTSAAVNQVSNLTISTGGYIITQRVYESNGHTFATIQIGVPVTEYERAMQMLRELGVVLRDASSGIDVTDEYVDLESMLENLEIKQERLQTFMRDAKKIEDVLKIEDQLSEVEAELGIIKGRMNFLADRAAYSTIDIQIDPDIPTPTPSPTPTMTPIPTVEAWRPADTAQLASVQAQESFQNTADFVIYNGIVCGPWLLFLGLLLFLFIRFVGTPSTVMGWLDRSPDRAEIINRNRANLDRNHSEQTENDGE